MVEEDTCKTTVDNDDDVDRVPIPIPIPTVERLLLYCSWCCWVVVPVKAQVTTTKDTIVNAANNEDNDADDEDDDFNRSMFIILLLLYRQYNSKEKMQDVYDNTFVSSTTVLILWLQ